MRVPQPEGLRGSLKWLQRAINRSPFSLRVPAIGDVEWLSPLAADDHAEYSDGDFLDRLDLTYLSEELQNFWPRRGPQWDALGRSGDIRIIVEAKAHIGEFLSPPTAAKGGSRSMIERALGETKTALHVTSETDWSSHFYQYTNRLAHLHFLRKSGVDARLLLVGFIGDTDMGGPKTAAEWKTVYRVADHALGLSARHPLSAFIHHIHPDVTALS